MATFTYAERKKSGPDLNGKLDQFLRRNWLECLIIIGLLYVVMCRDVVFTIGYQAPQTSDVVAASGGGPDQAGFALLSGLTRRTTGKEDPVAVIQSSVIPAELDRNEAARLQTCQAFVQRFAKVALAEQKKFGIPASITLATALLKSRAGESASARQANNFFGRECTDEGTDCKSINGVHYRHYDSPWASIRDHSLLLRSEAYSDLYRLRQDDYQGWAAGLHRTGYFSDVRQAEKVVQIIESLELFLFDRNE